jgi:hypothetical protein
MPRQESALADVLLRFPALQSSGFPVLPLTYVLNQVNKT